MVCDHPDAASCDNAYFELQGWVAKSNFVWFSRQVQYCEGNIIESLSRVIYTNIHDKEAAESGWKTLSIRSEAVFSSLVVIYKHENQVNAEAVQTKCSSDEIQQPIICILAK